MQHTGHIQIKKGSFDQMYNDRNLAGKNEQRYDRSEIQTFFFSKTSIAVDKKC